MNVVGETKRKDMGRPKTDNVAQLVVRVPQALRDRIKKLMPLLSQPGVSVTEADVTRVALMRGVDELEAQLHKTRGKR
jgi:hypothetical protein